MKKFKLKLQILHIYTEVHDLEKINLINNGSVYIHLSIRDVNDILNDHIHDDGFHSDCLHMMGMGSYRRNRCYLYIQYTRHCRRVWHGQLCSWWCQTLGLLFQVRGDSSRLSLVSVFCVGHHQFAICRLSCGVDSGNFDSRSLKIGDKICGVGSRIFNGSGVIS